MIAAFVFSLIIGNYELSLSPKEKDIEVLWDHPAFYVPYFGYEIGKTMTIRRLSYGPIMKWTEHASYPMAEYYVGNYAVKNISRSYASRFLRGIPYLTLILFIPDILNMKDAVQHQKYRMGMIDKMLPLWEEELKDRVDVEMNSLGTELTP